MFKLFLSLTFAVSLASAATISTSATCDGVTTVGVFSASCDDGRVVASASLQSSGMPFISVSAGALGVPPPLASASAVANFFDDYVFNGDGRNWERVLLSMF